MSSALKLHYNITELQLEVALHTQDEAQERNLYFLSAVMLSVIDRKLYFVLMRGCVLPRCWVQLVIGKRAVGAAKAHRLTSFRLLQLCF